MHRGTSIEQDPRFSRQKKKRAKSGPQCFKETLNLKNVLWDSIDRWVELRTTALLEGVEDEILVGFIHESLTSKDVCPYRLAADLEGFLGDKAEAFVEELWKLLIDASSNPAGVPTSFLSQSRDDRRRDRRRDDRWSEREREYRPRERGDYQRRERSRSPRQGRWERDRRQSRETYLESRDVVKKEEETKE